MNYQIYYLLSEEKYMENPNYEKIMSKYKWVDPDHMDNLFEVIKVDTNVYKIIKIYKNKGCDGKFKIDDMIYFSSGMISFYIKNEVDEIKEIEVYPTVLIKKEELTLYNEKIDTKIDELIDLLTIFNSKNIINVKYQDILNSLNFFQNS